MNEYIQGFNVLVHNMLLNLGFTVIAQPQNLYPFIPDYYIEKGGYKAIVEAQAYRSSRVSGAMIYTAALQLIAGLKQTDQTHDNTQLILICSGFVGDGIKEKIRSETGVIIWDRKNIAAFTEDLPASSFDEFFHYFLSTQQGTTIESSLPYQTTGIEKDPVAYFVKTTKPIQIKEPPKEGELLSDALKAIEPGQSSWQKFEEIGHKILDYLFKDDICAWKKQNNTDDDLSRFDLIGRIITTDDFWKTIVTAFNSRYVIFEFKNYTKQIKQHEIYTTERYLFPKALRGTAIIISRKGPSDQAKIAATGALRETGKLILMLDDSDLLTMLHMRDKGESPNDYLSEKLDAMLMTVSR